MNFQSEKSFGKLRLRTFQPYHQILYILTLSTLGISISNAFNAIYVDTVDTKHIHTFLPIQCTSDLSTPINQIITQHRTNVISANTFDQTMWHNLSIYLFYLFNFQQIFNPQKVLESWDSGLFNHTINTIYVDTVDTRQGSLMHSMLSMSTLSIQFSHLIVLCIRCCVRATYTSVDSVNKHSIKCIVCFDLHINSVDKQDTLLNTQ